jgi:hypothetical protein
LNPYYSYYLNELYYKNNQSQTRQLVVNNSQTDKLDFKYILDCLQKPINNDSRTIREEAKKIFDVLYVSTKTTNTQKAIIYVPDYYKPRIMKCVYSDLTFGILDEETVNQRISQETIKPESFYQLYLIKQQSGYNGYYEPVIYIQLPLQNIKLLEEYKYFIKYNKYLNKQIHQQIIDKANKNNPYFNYCIYTDRNILKIITYNPNNQYEKFLTQDFNEKLSTDDKIKMACSILLTIPDIFESLEGVKRIAYSIIDPKKNINPIQPVRFKGNSLRQPLLSPF